MHPGDAFGRQGEAKIRESLIARRDVEEAVQQVRPRTRARDRNDLGLRRERLRHQPGDLGKRDRLAGDGIERAGAALEQDAAGELGDVLDQDMVALLLASPKIWIGLPCIASRRNRFGP